jgi:nitrate reductase NapE component
MEEFSEEEMKPLTKSEIARVRKSLKRDAITEATFVVLGKFALWITAIVGAYFAGKNFIVELLSK